MRLAIFEPAAGGHHMIYVRNIAAEALRRGWSVCLVTSTASLTHPATKAVLAKCDGLQTLTSLADVPFPASGGMIKLGAYQVRQFTNFAHAYQGVLKECLPDFIYCVNFEYFNRAMVVLGTPFGATPFGGMLMRLRFHHREFGLATPGGCREAVNREAFHRLLCVPPLRLVTTCDELLPTAVRRAWPGRAWKIAYVPEISTGRTRSSVDCARRALGIAPDRFVVLAYGEFSMRKGIAQLLAAAARSNSPANTTVILAGPPSEDIAALLQSPTVEGLRRAGRLKEFPGFLDAAAEHNVFCAADIAWLGYCGHYESSAVLVQAAAMGVPVVACDEGLIAWWTCKYGVGEIVRVADTDSVVSALSRLAADKELRGRYSTNGLALSKSHSPGVFSAAVCDAIANALKERRSTPA